MTTINNLRVSLITLSQQPVLIVNGYALVYFNNGKLIRAAGLSRELARFGIQEDSSSPGRVRIWTVGAGVFCSPELPFTGRWGNYDTWPNAHGPQLRLEHVLVEDDEYNDRTESALLTLGTPTSPGRLSRVDRVAGILEFNHHGILLWPASMTERELNRVFQLAGNHVAYE